MQAMFLVKRDEGEGSEELGAGSEKSGTHGAANDERKA